MIRTCLYLKNRRGALVAFLVLAAMAAVPMPMWGQWNGTNPIWTNSDVGIGTASPGARLNVQSTAGAVRANSWADFTSSGCGLASVGQNVCLNSADNSWRWSNTHSRIGGAAIQLGVCWAERWNDIVFWRAAGTTGSIATTTDSVAAMVESMRITSSGSVGIGTTNPQYKLAVNGNIGAQDIIVTNTGWSDYVFKPGYRLRPLSEVSAYIHKHRHLPDIPTEAEVMEKGVSLGDMQAKLLAKVEELTLHLIQQEKENKELRERMAQLENRVVAGNGLASDR